MTGLVPLFLMWLWSRETQPITAPTAPIWPTPISPPPMPPAMPAFQSQPPPTSADTGTPLAELHSAPPKPPPIAPVAKVLKSAAAARSAATRAAQALRLNVKKSPAQAQRTASVVDLQTIANARGAKLKRDGLYGPKTASAWSSIARSKGLPATISRVGPKIARVVTQTYDTLRVPPIP